MQLKEKLKGKLIAFNAYIGKEERSFRKLEKEQIKPKANRNKQKIKNHHQ